MKSFESFLARGKRLCQTKLLTPVVRIWEQIEWCYFRITNPNCLLGHPPRHQVGATLESYRPVFDRLSTIGLCPVDTYVVDVKRYSAYLDTALYPKGAYGKYFCEKTLEHFISFEFLDLSSTDLYLDVASAVSPFAQIAMRLYGCRVIWQDLRFPQGHMNASGVVSNAAYLPLAPESVDKMALHCSFEHFEGDADFSFMSEAARCLRPGGKLVILPLYQDTSDCILTHFKASRQGLQITQGFPLRYVPGAYRERHMRFYSPETFTSRILAHVPQLDLKLYVVQNPEQVDPRCYVRFVAVFRKV